MDKKMKSSNFTGAKISVPPLLLSFLLTIFLGGAQIFSPHLLSPFLGYS